MALKLAVKTKKNLEIELEEKRALLKALSEEDRANSQELQNLIAVENKLAWGIWSYPANCPEAYLKVTHISGSAEETAIAHISIFTNQEDRDNGGASFQQANVPIPTPSGEILNLSNYAYQQIKQMPEFAGALDV